MADDRGEPGALTPLRDPDMPADIDAAANIDASSVTAEASVDSPGSTLRASAAQLAEPYLSQLLMVVPEQDQGFLHRTGSSLDMLSLKRLVSPPPKPHRTWKSALAEMKRASEPSLGASES